MMIRQIVTYITAPLACKAFASTNPAFGEASGNSDLGKLIEMSLTFIETKIKMLKERVEETPEDSWDIWHNGNI
jgi:hypothetical protein